MAQILEYGDTKNTFKPEADFLITAHGDINTTVCFFCMPIHIYNDLSVVDKEPYWTELDPRERITEDVKSLYFRFTSGYVCQARASEPLTDPHVSINWGHLISVPSADALKPAPSHD